MIRIGLEKGENWDKSGKAAKKEREVLPGRTVMRRKCCRKWIKVAAKAEKSLVRCKLVERGQALKSRTAVVHNTA